MQTFPTPPDFEEHSLSDQVTFGTGVVSEQKYGKALLVSQREPTLTKPTAQKLLRVEQDPNSKPIINNNGTEERLLASQDRRKQIKSEKTKTFPYSAIVSLNLKFKGNIYRGSGALVGPCHVLTASHNIYDSALEKWADSIEVIPALDGTEAPFGIAAVCHIHRFVLCDLALLILDRPIGDLTGWFGMIAYPNGKKASKQKDLRVTGYPYKDNHANKMWSHKGDIEEYDNTMIRYNIDTTAGQSGSPIWLKDLSHTIILGIHTYGPDPEAKKELNVGVFLNYARLEKIKEWLERRYFITSDLKPPIITMVTLTSEALEPNLNVDWLRNLQSNYREFFIISSEEKNLIIRQVDINRISSSLPKKISFSKIIKDLFNSIITMPLNNSTKCWETLNIEFTKHKSIPREYDSFPFKQLNELITSPRFKSLRHLDLNLLNWKKGTTDDSGELADLGETLRNSQLESLYLSLGGYNSGYDDKAIENFISLFAFGDFPKLQTLHLDFSSCYEATDASIINLSVSLAASSFNTMKDFSLTFGQCQPSDESLFYLVEALTSDNFSGLQSLRLILPFENEITDLGIAPLTTAFASSSFKSLHTLLLNFESCTLISSNSISQLQKAIDCCDFSQLKTLQLHYPPTKSPLKAFNTESGSPSSNSLSRLHNLTFDAIGTIITSEEWSNFFGSLLSVQLKGFEHLQYLSLSFTDHSEGIDNYPDDWTGVFNSQNFPNLKSLKIGIVERRNYSLQCLTQAISSENFPTLESLSLVLEFGNHKREGNDLKQLAQALSSPNLKKLKELYLGLINAPQDQINQFTSNCRSIVLKDIERLDLYFTAWMIKKKSFSHLINGLIYPHIYHLKSLNLVFTKCRFKDKHLILLTNALAAPKQLQLQALYLDLREDKNDFYKRLTSDGVWYFATKFSALSLPQLTHIYLHFDQIKNCPKKFEKTLANLFIYPNNKNLEKFYLEVHGDILEGYI